LSNIFAKNGNYQTSNNMPGQTSWKEALIISNEREWEQLGGGIERKILGYDDQLMMVVVRFEKGAVGSLHHHFHRQVSYVASGKFEVNVDGNKKILQQGDSFFVAPDLIHGVEALEAGSLVDIFTPAREDFL
jgi:quercetin dioxygenase-like cupin family protein